MTRKKLSKGSGRDERRAQYPSQMSSAPHQPKTTGNAEAPKQYVVHRQPPGAGARHSRDRSDLPPDLFPQPPGGGIWKWLGLPLIPFVLFIMIYFGANAGSAMVEKGWVAPNSLSHSILCTGLDRAISAGLRFEAQLTRAQCAKN